MQAKAAIGIIAILSAALTARAQDIHFSQFYENSIIRNPALTGIFSGDYKAGVNFKTQWNSIAAPYRTGLATFESRVKVNEVNDYFSFGISLVYDQAGSTSFNSVYVYPAVNYNKSINDQHASYLSVGVAAGYAQRSVNASKMTFGDQYQPGIFDPVPTSESIPVSKVSYFDAGAGISWNSSIGSANKINYYVGCSAYHLNTPRVSFASDEAHLRLPIKYTGSAGMQWMINEQAVLSLHGNYADQGINREVVTGFLACWRSFDISGSRKMIAMYAGVFYRWGDAWIPTCKLEYKGYAFTLSYDVNTSGLVKASAGRGGFELSLFTKGFWKKTVNKTSCPRFEQMLEYDF